MVVARPGGGACSTLESVVVGFTRRRRFPSRRARLLNARKRRCRVHTGRGRRSTRSRRSAQRSKASLSGSHRYCNVQLRVRVLLNARKRRCRVHVAPEQFNDISVFCSTLESVVVGFTIAPMGVSTPTFLCSTLESVVVGFTGKPPERSARSAILLNARKRRCRVHGVGRSYDDDLMVCSTLESVVVGFTPIRDKSPRSSAAAQRSKASLSGSHARIPDPRQYHGLLNARKRRCRVHWRRRRPIPILPGLLNARKRRCRVHQPDDDPLPPLLTPAQRSKASLSGSHRDAKQKYGSGAGCSTLESVVVGFTSSGGPTSMDSGLLNARKRRCRVHWIKSTGSTSGVSAQRSKASLSGSPLGPSPPGKR